MQFIILIVSDFLIKILILENALALLIATFFCLFIPRVVLDLSSPTQGLHPCPPHLELEVLTTGPEKVLIAVVVVVKCGLN